MHAQVSTSVQSPIPNQEHAAIIYQPDLIMGKSLQEEHM